MSTANWAYINNIQQLHYQKQDIELEQVKKYLSLITEFIPKGFFFPSLFVVDYTKRKYHVFKSPQEGFFGYDARDYINNGLEFTIDRMQKDDFAIFNEQLFSTILNTLKGIPATEQDQVLFTFTWRLKNKEGLYPYVLQRCKYITDKETGRPLFNYGMVMDITSVKQDSSLLCMVDRYSSINGASVHQNILTKYFYPDPQIAMLTKREREILLWMAEGLASKQIADRLKISENTVANHRKNILRKTNTNNVAQLIRYAIEYRII